MKNSVRTHDERLARRVAELARLAKLRVKVVDWGRRRLQWLKEQRPERLSERIGIAAARAKTKRPPNRVLRRRRAQIAAASRARNR